MPKDYESVRDACIKNKEKKSGKSATKEQIDACKKMAAIWYFNKHGKPVTHGSDILKIDISDFISNEKYAETISAMKLDGSIAIEESDGVSYAKILIDIDEQDSGIVFPQPFSKREVNYRLSELNSDGYLNECCILCSHCVTEWKLFGPGGAICHIVAGLISDDMICDYFTTNLIGRVGANKINE